MIIVDYKGYIAQFPHTFILISILSFVKLIIVILISELEKWTQFETFYQV